MSIREIITDLTEWRNGKIENVSACYRKRVTSERAVNVSRVTSLLAAKYGDPRLGNKRNPLDELVYIILSTRTQESSFQANYKLLKAEFPSWNVVRGWHRKRILAILRPNGLAELKTNQILSIMQILRRRFGRATLALLRKMSDARAEDFLLGLPGVSKKVAKCVLMYSLDRQVLPVDVHVHRLAGRLGLPVKRRPDSSQDAIESAVAPKYRYSFHVNAVAHGRELCLPRRPKCRDCPIFRYCRYVLVLESKT